MPSPKGKKAFLRFRVILFPGMVFAVLLFGRPLPAREEPPLTTDQIRKILLVQVNEEREHHGLGPLQLDDLACRVADEHAADMIAGRFISHWGRDGRKPYMRYSHVGGTDGVAENVGAVSGTSNDLDSRDLAGYVLDMHKSMYEETPPNDGHRRTILQPYHTHVGFGFAFGNGQVRLVEEYVARYVEISTELPETATLKDTDIVVLGKILDRRHEFYEADIHYEPLPSPPDPAWLKIQRSYGLPEGRKVLFVKLPREAVYKDPNTGKEVRTTGDVAVLPDGSFRVPVPFYEQKPGVYTVVVWLRAGGGEPFPTTNICFHVK